MKGKIAKCVNCETENMKVLTNNEICPICGAVNTLVNGDNQQKELDLSENDILRIVNHTYEPTDTEGYTYDCTECGHYHSLWYGMEFTGAPLNEGELKDFSINKELHVSTNEGELNFYKDKNNRIYAEICSSEIIKNIKKLYGDNAIKTYKKVNLDNGLLGIEAVAPNHPKGAVVIYKDDCSDSFIEVLLKSYLGK